MEQISLPTSFVVKNAENNASSARIEVSPCSPGYGTTLGNAMRRVLLSSLPGAAATAMKIKGVEHEFSTIPHVKEDVVEIILKVKGLRFKVFSEEPVELELVKKGEGAVTAADFKANAQVEVMNPEAVIATLTDKAADFQMKIVVQKGRGYIPVEAREHEKMDVGYIAIDAVYTPVRTVNFKTEYVRVGQMTNYDKLILDIVTDGTVSPQEAFTEAARILVEQFQSLYGAQFGNEVNA